MHKDMVTFLLSLSPGNIAVKISSCDSNKVGLGLKIVHIAAYYSVLILAYGSTRILKNWFEL